MAILSLVAAYIIGHIQQDKEVFAMVTQAVPTGTSFQKISDNPFLLEGQNPEDPSFTGLYIVNKAKGWGGPLLTATIIDEEGILKQVIVLDHKETLSFFYRLQRKDFFKQFPGKKVSDPFIPGEHIDTVSQATVSSKAFIQAAREGSHFVGRDIFKLTIPEHIPSWNLGIQEVLLVLLFAGLALSLTAKIRILRYLSMLGAFILVGFLWNGSLSIAHFGTLFLGYLPSMRENLFWWLLVCGAILTAVWLRRNLYCYGLCPFGNLQEFNTKISGINLPLGQSIVKGGKVMSYSLTWLALIIIFLRANPTIGAYEPFATLFGLEGMEIQWFILAIVLFGSFIISRFFCRFFCPVGVILGIAIRVRCRVDQALKKETSCQD